MSKLIISTKDSLKNEITPDYYYFALMIFGFFLGLIFLGAFPLKLDEPLILDYIYFNVIQPDHYTLFYPLVRLFSVALGDDNISIRLLPFVCFLFSIHVFYRYLIFVFAAGRIAFCGVLLLLLNSFFLNISIYAYEYSMFFLAGVTSVFFFDKFLVTGKSLNKVTITNVLGLAVFTMFYHILLAQLLVLCFRPKTPKLKVFIAVNLTALAAHIIFVSRKLFGFRFNSGRPPSLFDRTLLEFVGDLAGIDLYSVYRLQPLLIVIALAVLLVFVGSLLYNFWKNRQLASRTGFYFLLFSVSLGSFFVFKLLNLREIEYRYYFYLAPIFIISALQLRTHLRLSHFRILLSFLFITQISGMLLFLIFVKYGENADFLRQLEASSRQTEKVPLYTDNLWNYKHIVLPVYYRMFRSLPVQLEATESNNFSSLSGDHFFILQFKPENYENRKLPETAIIKDQYQFECSRCDTDQIRLIEYKNSAK